MMPEGTKVIVIVSVIVNVIAIEIVMLMVTARVFETLPLRTTN